MPKGRVLQNSLNAGEMSPHMEGRVDFPRFQNSASTLENFLIHTQGGVSKRWGTKFIGAAKTGATSVRILPFIVDAETYYLLEFGVNYIRVHRPVGTIGHTTVVDLVTTYAEAELFEIDYAQSNDVMYLVHGSHPVQKLSRLDSYGDTWGVTSVTFNPPPTFEKVKDINTSLAFSATTGTGVKVYNTGTYFLAADVDSVIAHETGLAVITAVDASGKFCTVDILSDLPSGHVVAGLGTITAAATTVTTSVAHGLTAADIGDIIIVTSGAAAGDVRRIDGVPDGTHLTVDAAFSAPPGGGNWNRGVHIGHGEHTLFGSPSSKLTSDKTGPVRAIATLTLATAGWRVEDVGKYVKAMGGIAKITAFTSSTVVKAQILAAFSSAPSTAPFETLAGTWTLEEESWTAENGYPSVVSFYEQRLIFGGTTEQPQTVWGSATADFENFAVGVLATDAVAYTIASNDVNKMRWMASSRVLLIGALSREFRASGGSSAITPSNIDIRGETSYGSLKRKPVQIGHTTMFLSASGRRLREMMYNFDNDAYKADDLTILNPEISTGGFNEVDYSKEPMSIVFAVRNDGTLCALTYEKSQEVMGWGRWITNGSFESVCVLPSSDSTGADNIYVVVNRNGDRLIEKFDSSVFTDSCVTGTGASATGLDHLEGMTVRVLSGGLLCPDAVVSGGAVAVPGGGAYEVGLNYNAKAVPARPDVQVNGVSSHGTPKAWGTVHVRVLDTKGLKINGNRSWVGATQDPSVAAPTAETGYIEAQLLGVDIDAQLTIEQDLPYAATILMIVGELAAGD